MTLRFIFQTIVFASLGLSPAFGASSEFQVNQPPGNPWKIGDTVCIDMDGENVCGKVTSAETDKVTVQKAARGKGITVVPKSSAPPKPSPLPRKHPVRPLKKAPEVIPSPAPPAASLPDGLPMFNPAPRPDPTPTPTPLPTIKPTPVPVTAEPAPPPKPTRTRRFRKPAAFEKVAEPVAVSSDQSDKEEQRRILLGPVVALGTSFFFPGAFVQVGLGDRWSLSAMGFFARGSAGSSNLQALGAFVTTSYFATPTAPFGFFVETGAGIYSLQGTNATRSDQISPPAALAVVGWRGITRSGFGGSISAGGQYVMGPASGAIRFHGPMPLLMMALHVGF